MPIYEYQCTKCNRMYDQLERSDAPKKQPCIDCGGLAERLMSAPAKGNMGNGNSGSNTDPSYNPSCPLCQEGYKGDLIVGIGIPVPNHIAEKIVKKVQEIRKSQVERN
jgi:putative FmdB family regulatory protein